MKNKKDLNQIFIGTVVVFLIGMILTSPEYFKICSTPRNCLDPYDDIIGQPLGIFSMTLMPILIILHFLREKAFNAWKKFAMVYLPISFILIAITPTTGGFMMPDREMISLWLAGIFFIISIIIILVKREKHGVLEEEEC